MPVHATIRLRSVAYALPAGHRIRLALSTTYWPWLWPSPEPVTITITTGGESSLSLPLRTPRSDDRRVREFAAAETAPALPITWLRRRRPLQEVTREIGERTVRILMRRDFAGARRLPSGLEYHDHDPVTFTIREDDPLSARVECQRRIELRDGDWRTHVELRSVMTADAVNYHVTSVIEAYERDERVHTRTFESVIPRNHT